MITVAERGNSFEELAIDELVLLVTNSEDMTVESLDAGEGRQSKRHVTALERLIHILLIIRVLSFDIQLPSAELFRLDCQHFDQEWAKLIRHLTTDSTSLPACKFLFGVALLF